MPLRDHFRSPVNDRHRWDAVHGLWPAKIVEYLFDALPAGYQAEPKIHLGSPVEVDVSTYDTDPGSHGTFPRNGATLTVPNPTFTAETDLAGDDAYEVRVYDVARGRRLVAAIEIVSPSNKHSPGNRRRFLAKIAGLLRNDVCVCVVDPVTTRRTNFYAKLLARYDRPDPQLAADPPNVYAVSLRTRRVPDGPVLLDAWHYPMTVGGTLPTLPIWISSERQVTLPLEPGYEETCRLLRIA